jgi:uncharacterized membrane protein YphA (DoxX/SURF4 family)
MPDPALTESTEIRMKSKPVLFWVVTVPVCVVFVGSGIANLVHATHVAQDMTHLGYPAYFSTILGTWKILGALAVAVPAFPRLKEWAYAGMMFDLTGAAISRGVVGDGVAGALPPLIIAGLVVASWGLRPRGRTLHARA